MLGYNPYPDEGWLEICTRVDTDSRQIRAKFARIRARYAHGYAQIRTRFTQIRASTRKQFTHIHTSSHRIHEVHMGSEGVNLRRV